jgi:hypothetical protein
MKWREVYRIVSCLIVWIVSIQFIAADDDLPWKLGPEDSLPELRTLLEPLGFDDAYWQTFQHGRTLDSDNREAGIRLLDRLAIFSPEQWATWRTSMPTTIPIDGSARGQVFEIRGQVKTVHGPYRLADEGLYGFKIDTFHVVDVKPDNGLPPCKVLCRQIPSSWSSAKNLHESCCFDGVLMVGGADGPYWFAADRLKWFVSGEYQGSIPIAKSWQFLGANGVDLVRVEALQKRNQRPLNNDDREAFYSILRVVSDPPESWQSVPTTPWELTDLLVAPQKFQGKRLRGRATARRVTKVLVDDPAIARRFGIDAYYQIDIFFPLDGTKIRLRSPDRPLNDARIYTNGYPATLVCRHLPKKLESAAKKVLAGTAKAELIKVPLDLDGVFFKVWSYRSTFLMDENSEQLHPSPLFLAAAVEVVESPQIGKSSRFSFGVLAVFIFFFAGAWALAWWSQRGWADRRKPKRSTDS